MKLSTEAKKELREYLAESIQNYSGEGLVTIDPKLLEQLIFEPVKINDKKYKQIVWDHECLKHIDLTDVSFDNVYWPRFERGLCLKDWNANIDFRTSYFGKVKRLTDVDLSGVDLSNSHLEYIDCFNNCRFISNNLSTSQLKELLGKLLFTCESENIVFEDDDLSEVTINMSDSRVFPEIVTLKNINLKNTGINLNISNSSFYSMNFRRLYADIKTQLTGTYINGNLIVRNDDMIDNQSYQYEEFREKDLKKRARIKKEIIKGITEASKLD